MVVSAQDVLLVTEREEQQPTIEKQPTVGLARARVRRAYFREGANPVARQFAEIFPRETIPQKQTNLPKNSAKFPAMFYFSDGHQTENQGS